jgi:hypothetical protein
MQAWLPAHHRLLRRVARTARDDPSVGTGNQKRAQRSRADSWEREANDVWPRSRRSKQTPDRLDPTVPRASTPREGRRVVVVKSCALHSCTQCRACRAIHSFFTWHDGLLRGTCHRARIHAARRLAMAMAEKLPRRRSSLIFSIHPSIPRVSRTKDGGLGVAQRKRRVSICLFPAWRSGEAREPASLQ